MRKHGICSNGGILEKAPELGGMVKNERLGGDQMDF